MQSSALTNGLTQICCNGLPFSSFNELTPSEIVKVEPEAVLLYNHLVIIV